jgi:hypothetical protein
VEVNINGYTSYVNDIGRGYEPEFGCTVKTYRDGSHRIRVSRLNPNIEQNVYLACSPKSRRDSGELTDDDKRRSLARTKTAIYDNLRTIQADRLLTLTVRENVEDIGVFHGFVKRFLRALKNYPALAFEYVCVFEQQARGAWHAHLALRNNRDVRLLRKLWLSIVGHGNGNIDMSYRRSSTVHGIARYLAKYISKNAELVGFNKKRYWSSKGIPKPEVIRFYMHALASVELAIELTRIGEALGVNLLKNSIWAASDHSVMLLDG